MNLQIRKLVNFEEEILLEGSRAAVPPLRQFAAAAVVKNPWHGRGYVEDLNPEIRAFAPILGKTLTERIRQSECPCIRSRLAYKSTQAVAYRLAYW